MKIRCLICSLPMHETAVHDRFVCIVCDGYIQIESHDESYATLEEEKKRSDVEMQNAKDNLDPKSDKFHKFNP